MQLFAKEQIVEGTIKDKSFKYPIPYIYFKPLKCDKKNIPIIVFVQGINGSTSAGKVMKCEFYNDKILFTYEKMSEGDNKNRASIQARKYISELKLIIEKIKTIYKNNPIYLLGQSFGSAICMQYIRKYPQDINGIACWNMPCKVIDVAKNSFGRKLFIGLKMTLVPLGFTTYNYNPRDPTSLLTSNENIIRMRKIAPLKKENNRACWAAWRILVKSWKLFKRDIANSNLNWLYIQTGQDYLLDKIQWKKINRKTKDKTKLIWNDYGYHMLAFEENAIKDIYKIIEEKLIRNNS